MCRLGLFLSSPPSFVAVSLSLSYSFSPCPCHHCWQRWWWWWSGEVWWWWRRRKWEWWALSEGEIVLSSFQTPSHMTQCWNELEQFWIPSLTTIPQQLSQEQHHHRLTSSTTTTKDNNNNNNNPQWKWPKRHQMLMSLGHMYVFFLYSCFLILTNVYRYYLHVKATGKAWMGQDDRNGPKQRWMRRLPVGLKWVLFFSSCIFNTK